MRLLLVLLLLAAGPTLAEERADARKPDLDGMFAALKAAPTEAASAELEARIRRTWQQSGSPAARLLVGRAGSDTEAGDTSGALDALDDALVLAPDDAEAWLARARAEFAAADYPGAIRDIEATLQREPRHFGAWRLLSRIAEARDDWKGALAAWRKVLELAPRTPDGQERLHLLERKVEGQAT
jgi:tetratricopeptide (TPR) repeat protein